MGNSRTRIGITCLMILPGCGAFPGHLRDERGFTDRHPSVRWVYHTGQQLIQPLIPIPISDVGYTWPLPVRMQSEIVDLRAGDGCVIATEGLPVIYEAHFSLGWRTVGLDLKTGSRTDCRYSKNSRDGSRFEKKNTISCASYGSQLLHFVDIGNGIALCSGCHKYEHPLCIGKRDRPVDDWIRLVDWKGDTYDWDKYGLLYNEMGPVNHVIRFPEEHVIVVAAGLLSLVCIDLNAIPELTAIAEPPVATQATQ